MPTYIGESYQDFSEEIGKYSIRVGDAISDGNITLLRDAIHDVLFGNLNEWSKNKVTRISNEPAASPNAQREERLEVSYEDLTTFKKYVVSFPTFDKSTVSFIEGTDNIAFDVDAVTPTPADELAIQFNAFVLSPAGNTVRVLKLRYVAHNS